MHNLSTFCNAILTALETGDYPEWFENGYGLCYNAGSYDEENYSRVKFELFLKLKEVADNIFPSCNVFPFNYGDSKDYLQEQETFTLYQNEKRLAFLMEHAK